MARTLLLDLDGTLVDTVDDIAAALNLVLRRRGLGQASRAETISLIGNGVHALLAAAFAARAAPLDPASAAEFLDFYEAHAADLSRPFPGVTDALATMAARNWRFAVCTNKPEAASRTLLAAVGLAPWFAAVGGGDSFPVRKPDPGHLLATLAAAGGSAGAAVMVGDHANDVRAAAGAGLPCIFAQWGYGQAAMGAGAAAAAERFAELPALCELLLPNVA
jgi:phosphoglycolate phosphatase